MDIATLVLFFRDRTPLTELVSMNVLKQMLNHYYGVHGAPVYVPWFLLDNDGTWPRVPLERVQQTYQNAIGAEFEVNWTIVTGWDVSAGEVPHDDRTDYSDH